MRTLDHPLKAEIEALRRMILESDPRIREGIKWNAPSFRVTDYFATFHLRSRDGVQVILHRGAKVKDNSTAGVPIQDPAGLLQWLALERATVRFADMADIAAKRRAFREIISQWVETM